jgi:hypothetical protein
MATLLAMILAMGGVLWGIFLLPGVVDEPQVLLIFGPGYLVTAGYFGRAIAPPSVPARRLLWGVSSLIQGLWLCFDIGMLVDIGGIHGSAWIFFIWWTFAFVSSVYCLFTDTEPLRLPG